MKISDGKKFRKVSKNASWVTPEVLAYYDGGNKQARLSYGLIGEQVDIWGVEIADVVTKELTYACAFDNANSALKTIKNKLK